MKGVVMKFFFLILALQGLTLQAQAGDSQAVGVDHLARFNEAGGAHFVCNAAERALGRPEINESCNVIMILNDREKVDDAVNRGEFGTIVHKADFAGSALLLISTVSVEQLERLRYDSRIRLLAPDFPLGPGGGFTVKN